MAEEQTGRVEEALVKGREALSEIPDVEVREFNPGASDITPADLAANRARRDVEIGEVRAQLRSIPDKNPGESYVGERDDEAARKSEEAFNKLGENQEKEAA